MLSKKKITDPKIETNHKFMLVILMSVFIWSGINPHSYETWFPLAVPVVIFGIPIFLTYKKFKFSTFVYLVILTHAIIVLIGAKYTYTYNPLFDFLMK